MNCPDCNTAMLCGGTKHYKRTTYKIFYCKNIECLTLAVKYTQERMDGLEKKKKVVEVLR